MVDSVTPDRDKCHARITSRVTKTRKRLQMSDSVEDSVSRPVEDIYLLINGALFSMAFGLKTDDNNSISIAWQRVGHFGV